MTGGSGLATRLRHFAADTGGVICLLQSEALAARLGRELRRQAIDAAWFPGWDCLPYDRAPPSRRVMGLRMAALGRFAHGHGPCVLVTTLDAALQRLPPPASHKSLRLRVGEPYRATAIEAGLGRLGYRLGDHVGLPGDAAAHAEVLDVWPPDRTLGVRIEHAGGVITACRHFDPMTQHGDATPIDRVVFGPAIEPQLASADATTLFALLPDAALVLDTDLDAHRASRLQEIEECYHDRLRQKGTQVPRPPAELYLNEAEWRQAVADRPCTVLDEGETDSIATDVAPPRRIDAATLLQGDGKLHVGDAVVHAQHGVAVLRGIEMVESAGTPTECLRLGYAGGMTLMVQVDELDQVWRYGAEGEAVSLDRLHGDWPARRAKVEAEIAETAETLVRMVKARDAAQAPAIDPPRAKLARFAARFLHEPTADQAEAIAAVLADLRRGRPMDRLVCGDVGYGKTEVALRAAAAAALCGWQVAVLAPTTVLARQHLIDFTRRFARTGIRVAGLSRLTPPAEARAVRAGIADCSIGVVIGTHALAGRDVTFAKLGLIVIDEEQRFGTRQKAALRDLARPGAQQTAPHVLTMTATPIPRTLQSALVGLQELSVIATPPMRRQPVRAVVEPFDPATLRAALEHEHRRGGQSFVVAPRIDDLPMLRAALAEAVPDLHVIEAHGKLPPAEMDAAMTGFAAGEGDILLSTNIIETGLDVPRANTMLIWRADRFGLSQLHQLRGRVGRGGERGMVYMLTDPAHPPGVPTDRRLRTLEEADQLGAGFAISARDLDLRGAGDLVGDTQAGHVKLIGMQMYQTMLARALARAHGETVLDDWAASVALNVPAYLPEDYMPAEARIAFHTDLAQMLRDGDANGLDRLGADIADRFGPPPATVRNLLLIARLRAICRRTGVERLEAGPHAIAATLHQPVRNAPPKLRRHGERLILDCECHDTDTRLHNAEALLHQIAPANSDG